MTTFPVQWREAWELPGERIADGSPPPQNAGIIDTTVVHWPGFALDDSTPVAIAHALQSMQRDYLRNRGYSLGYLWLVDPTGVAWEIRGFDYKSAANKGHNDHTAPLLVTVNGDEPVTAVAWRTVRALSAEYSERSNRDYLTRPVPHSDLDGAATACPGDTVRTQIAAGNGDIGNDDDMTNPVILWRHPAYLNVFAVGGGAVWINETVRDRFLAQGAVEIVEDDPAMLRGCMAAAGIVDSDLVRVP